MSSTEKQKQDALRIFFNKELMPLARKLKDAGRPMFPTGAEPGAVTYFKTRARTAMSREDFALPGVDSPAAFAGAMKAHWERSKLPEMAALAPTMGKLAEILRGEPEKDEEVSPFIYVMF
jgi:hypothetical protein